MEHLKKDGRENRTEMPGTDGRENRTEVPRTEWQVRSERAARKGRERKSARWCLFAMLFLMVIIGRLPAEASGTEEETEYRPRIVMIPEEANKHGYYKEDVAVKIFVEDDKDGIQRVEYRITSEGQETTPYQEIYACREGEELLHAWEGSLTVDAAVYNSGEVKVWARVTSEKGGVYTTKEEEACSLKICTDEPAIEVRIDGTLHREAKAGYYNGTRKATVTVIDRADVFDEKAASQSIRIGKDGKEPAPQPAMVSGWTSRGKRHSAVITFAEDGRYQWEVLAYTNRAGLSSGDVTAEGDTPYVFTVDTEPPLTSDTPDKEASWIGYGEKRWSKLAGKLCFGTWETQEVTVQAEGRDRTSPVYKVNYYKTNGTESPALGRETLEVLYAGGAFTESLCTIRGEEQAAVYARITDYAGNTAYISTDGVIVDQTAPQAVLRPSVQPNAAGFYLEDVRVAVRVQDLPKEGAAYSGIRSVGYTIKNPVTQETEEGNLYTFDKENPGKEELTGEWSGETLTVDAEKFDAGGILVTVTAIDNAGNESTASLSLNICKRAPEVTAAFQDTPYKEEGGRGYFGRERKALLLVRDREDVFDGEAVNVKVRAVDSAGVPVVLDEGAIVGPWRREGDVYIAELTFAAEGHYEFALSYKNKAGLAAKVSYQGASPQKFTVDTTKPEGSVTIQKHTWKELLSILTFGLYSNTEAKVTAEARDAISPVVIEYFKTDNPRALTAAQLEGEAFEPYPMGGFTVSGDEQFVVYLKITDYAGNYVYLSSDGYIVDKARSRISLLPETENKNGIYRQDVKVAVKISDPKPYSGIQSVRYEVKNQGKCTQSGVLYTFEEKRPPQSALKGTWETIVTVDAKKNNSCDVELSVYVKDNAGNEAGEALGLDIDVTPPSVELLYEQGKGNHGSRYFAAPRRAVVQITERAHHFDGKEAREGFRIRAVDGEGKEVKTGRDSMLTDWKTEEGETPEESVHRAEITYAVDGNYTVAFSFTDKAGNANGPVSTGDSAYPWKFTVDRTAPTGSVTARKRDGAEGEQRKTWENKRFGRLRFGLISGKAITVTAKAADATSPIESLRYYKSSRKTALTKKELESLADRKWRGFRGKTVEIVPNEQAVIYLRITDRAGNVSYISSGGLLADKARPRLESFAPQITIRPEQPANGFYCDDVTVDLAVRECDTKTKEPYAGLKTIRYEVWNMGKKTQGGIRDGSPEGLLYSFQKKNPGQRELRKSWRGTVLVDGRKNNSNQVLVKVYAEDNAGNVTTGRKLLRIDTTPPQIHVSYSDRAPGVGSYYSSQRTATVTVTERNFSAEDVVCLIQNASGPSPALTPWRREEGSGNGDNTRYTARFTCYEDGDYTFRIACTDRAGNRSPEVVYDRGTENPTEFTIDRTAPVVRVAYDNNDAKNGRYFKERRTGTVTVTERNFDRDRVLFTQTASLDGNPIDVPQPSWSSLGDVHTAVFSYTEDGDYTFDVAVTDRAGNPGEKVSFGVAKAARAFTVDTGIGKPEITGVENGKSYGGDVLPLIQCKDVNLAEKKIRLFRTRKGEKKKDVTEEFIAGLKEDGGGASDRSNLFPRTAENDGIYSLLVEISDLAGNEEAEEVTFTVNRFGSVYVFGEALLSLRDAYPQKIEENLVITEYNPAPLVENSLDIQITRDGMPLEHVRCTAEPQGGGEEAVGESGWYEYRYEIDAENFKEDGIYRLAVASEDETGNRQETLDFEEMMFRVDTTPPEITDVTGLEQAVVNGEERQVRFEVFDAIGLGQVTVYVDGVEEKRYRSFEDRTRCEGAVTLGEGAGRKIRLVAKDLAGNVTDTDAKDGGGRYKFQPEFAFVRNITISTSPLVRWYAKQRIFWRTMLGAAAASLGIFGLIKRIKRRKRK